MKQKTRKIIKLEWRGKVLQGYLMQRPELYDSGYLVLKLSNGYNVGLLENECKILEEREEVMYEPFIGREYKDGDLTIISTGGTIGSKVDYVTGGVEAKLTAEDFVGMLPELKRLAKIKAEILPNIMSEDINYEYWKLLAKTIYKEVKNNPVLITHGTDTMHYSSSLMNFFVYGGNYPRIFVGAQRSIDRGSSDAFMNLFGAVLAAKTVISNESLVAMHASMNDDFIHVHHGTRVRKMHTSRRDAFKSINAKIVAEVDVNNMITKQNDDAFHDHELQLDTKFESNVAMQYIYPNMDEKIFDYYKDNNYKGVILLATGLGHVPTKKPNVVEKVKELIKDGIFVGITSQTLYGSTNPYVYSNLRKLSIYAKAVYLNDMLPETAYLKLSWVLGHGYDIEQAKQEMLRSYANEISEKRIE